VTLETLRASHVHLTEGPRGRTSVRGAGVRLEARPRPLGEGGGIAVDDQSRPWDVLLRESSDQERRTETAADDHDRP
jgi:hypothetical protein